MPRIVGRHPDGALVVAIGGACVVVGPSTVDDTGRCGTTPDALHVRLVSTAAVEPGFSVTDEPMPAGLLSADQIAAVLAWEAGYVEGVDGDGERPGLDPAETELYLRYRPDTGDSYAGRAVPDVVDRPFSLDGLPIERPEIESSAERLASPVPEPELVVQLCASMSYVEDLSGPEIVTDAATDLIDRISYVATVAEFYPALAHAVTTGSVPDTAVELAAGFSEDDILDFLRRLVAELDRRRPWPEPALVSVDPHTWPSLGASVPIGWVDIPITDLEWAVKAGFADVPPGDNPLLVLRMRSGHLLALVGDEDPNPSRFLVLLPEVEDRPDAAEVTAYLERYAGLTVWSEGLTDALAEAMRS